ncbi:Uncharacterized protein TCM_026008 [Theobroma cacao]|uniref:Uncharacterized protein n=1 Tax=Theobroma cacao TaxID=3641 RepID=A0A061F8A0_THECC|nr:Uncharacterized protein TCM_026008 [Theobroma cacao]
MFNYRLVAPTLTCLSSIKPFRSIFFLGMIRYYIHNPRSFIMFLHLTPLTHHFIYICNCLLSLELYYRDRFFLSRTSYFMHLN